jgi:hypothetical protein
LLFHTGSNSINRNKTNRRDDFPAPVRPHTPIFSCAFIAKETSVNTNGRPGRYLNKLNNNNNNNNNNDNE